VQGEEMFERERIFDREEMFDRDSSVLFTGILGIAQWNQIAQWCKEEEEVLRH